MKYFLLLFLLSVALSTGAVAFLWWLIDRAVQVEETGTRYDCETGTWYVSEDGEIVQQKHPPHHNTPRK